MELYNSTPAVLPGSVGRGLDSASSGCRCGGPKVGTCHNDGQPHWLVRSYAKAKAPERSKESKRPACKQSVRQAKLLQPTSDVYQPRPMVVTPRERSVPIAPNGRLKRA